MNFNATFFTLFFSFALWSQLDSCDWNIPKTITINCDFSQYSSSYPFPISNNCKLKEYQITIYNKWGETVYESNKINEYWDSGENETGLFIWKIRGEYFEGNKFSFKGVVSFIK